MDLQALTNEALCLLDSMLVIQPTIHRDIGAQPAKFRDVVNGVCLDQLAYVSFNRTSNDLRTCVLDHFMPACRCIANSIDQALLSHTYEFFHKFIPMDSIKSSLDVAKEEIKEGNLFLSPQTEHRIIESVPPRPETGVWRLWDWDAWMLSDIWTAQDGDITHSFNLALGPEALTFVCRPLEQIHNSHVGIDENVAIRVSEEGRTITCEVLYGTAVRDREQGCILYDAGK